MPRPPEISEIPPTPNLLRHLHSVLLDISSYPYPHVPNPPDVKKRASVALIIRIQPRYSHPPPPAGANGSNVSGNQNNNEEQTVEQRLEAFFSQEWVQNGDPEVLFIKRAHRPGDRWTSHVALPGGRRDPEDDSDRAAAVRETFEEVGISLDASNSIAVGNLPERVVTTSWGKVPLMVLCPFVYIMTGPEPPALRLQPSEVASAHWVSVRALLSPGQRTFWHEDVSNRIARQEFGLKRAFLRFTLGKMIFAAVRLIPSHSSFASTIPGFVPDDVVAAASSPSSTSTSVSSWHSISLARLFTPAAQTDSATESPLLLWGLTLGIMADFLDLLPPHNSVRLWTYPTFTSPDVRFILWALSYRFRTQKAKDVLGVLDTPEPVPQPTGGVTAIEEGLEAVGTRNDESVVIVKAEEEDVDAAPESGISGLGVERYYSRLGRKRTRSSAVGVLLDGYYEIVRKAVAAAAIGRVSVVVAAVAWACVRLKRR
ncbi:nudix family hydrolase [Phyllosticta citricarpa]|uniref:Nudix family hydrolase n=2 Tax=Phyllosticta TaxID=121621 RepID=A0ABR1LKJ1_9PEZI